MRSLGDVVDGITAVRLDTPAAAALKGSLRIRRVLARASRDTAPGGAHPVPRLRSRPGHPARRPRPGPHPRTGPAQPPPQPRDPGGPAPPPRPPGPPTARGTAPSSSSSSTTTSRSRPSCDVVAPGRPTRGPALDDRRGAGAGYGQGVLAPGEAVSCWPLVNPRTGDRRVVGGRRRAHRRPLLPAGHRSRSSRRGARLLRDRGVRRPQPAAAWPRCGEPPALTHQHPGPAARRRPMPTSDSCRVGSAARGVRARPRRRGAGPPPMQWRMLAAAGRVSSWTVVGDAAQASWPDADEAAQARGEAFGSRSGGSSTWTPTTATHARSSTTPRRS